VAFACGEVSRECAIDAIDDIGNDLFLEKKSPKTEKKSPKTGQIMMKLSLAHQL
jgi:hypothetical protein